MKTILLAALAVFALSHNVMADDSAVETTKDSTTKDSTATTTHKHMKKGHGKKMMKKTETKSDTDAAAPEAK